MSNPLDDRSGGDKEIEYIDGIPLVEPGGSCGKCGTRWVANDATLPCPTCGAAVLEIPRQVASG